MIRRTPNGTLARRSGFSLLEVILAFAIFLMSMAGINQLITLGHDQAMDAAHQTMGTRLAESKMAEVEAGMISMWSNSSGSFEEAPNWQWEILVGDEVTTLVSEVTVRVWNSNNQRVEIRLTQMICDPTTMGTGAEAQPPMAATTTTGTTP